MRSGQTLLLLFFMFFGVSSLTAADTVKIGILIDAMCGEMSARNAEKSAAHKVSCSLMPNCSESGFGIVADGRFYKFDEGGDQAALDIFENTKKTENLTVKVTGDFLDDSVQVSKLEEVR